MKTIIAIKALELQWIVENKSFGCYELMNLHVDVVIDIRIYLNLNQKNSIHFTSSFIEIKYFLLRIKIELRQEVIKTSPWQFTDFTTKNMLCEKTFKSVGGKQSEKNCGDLCPQEKSESKSVCIGWNKHNGILWSNKHIIGC